ncbi:FAD-dependent oxidoreductase [Burkholderia cenocepacia]|uniref:FAD-dependent oxidoreductase n=1 Tax=Burkholderia cenocepacia TaxID=95486 RepID=UPI00285DC700|nr:FAD-dependent oxidoreductase [Burkholderia cenocepacia]MDR5646537.1 FAD-dependent oxidoreductase [Burkholderia cenocepacia]
MNERFDCEVLVVGGGPAGIAAAVELRRRGVASVVLLEREPELGGVPRHCGHPPFGMREFGRVYRGPVYAARLAGLAARHGVQIRTGVTVTQLAPGGTVHIADASGPAQLSAARVLLATGVRESPRSARLVSGDRPVGVLNTGALQSFVYQRHLVPFRRPLIVGTELVAISAVLTCLKAGIRPVGMVEAAARPTTRRLFMALPRLCSVPVWYGTRLEEIVGASRVEGARLRGPDGAPRAIDCDGILFTGQFVPESTLVRASHLLLDSGTGGPVVDQHGRCSDPAFFAAGNLLRPVETAGWSFREGRRIGATIAGDLQGRRAGAPTGTTVRVERGDNIKLAMPQRLVMPIGDAGLGALQVRVTQAVDGVLEVRAGARVLWQQPVSALPERRMLVPLAGLALPPGTDTLRVAVRPQA